MKRLLWAAAALLPCFALLTGCHSYQIQCTVKNRTGAPIELMEVDYPSAGFGLDSLANGADFGYRFEVRGSGPVTVQYTVAATHKLVKITGPDVEENQQGTLEIVLMPDGKAQFYPELSGPK
ncbi:MAG TPA: hypothetical protein VND90_01270 [Terracidiphilus sp.]|nr:hypothetical protein [Terracidiphilus sp.]